MRRREDAMHVYHADLVTQAVPRYTSYPTAAVFDDRVGALAQAGALAAIPLDMPVSLYIHIPYCREICWYCGCNTGAIGKAERLQQYLAALRAEIATVAQRMRGKVVALHFGGGSPNALSPDDFVALVAELRRAFAIDDDAECAVELDPRHVDATYAAALARAGVTRASLGVQTLALRVQAAIGRIQPRRMIATAFAALRDAGIKRVNADLMYGLPGQSLDDIAATIAAIAPLQPDRIAMFGYAHAPQMFPRQRRIAQDDLPDAEARFWQSALAYDLLCEAGYAAIGFDHFARPDDSLAIAAAEGRLRRNFQGFTDEPATAIIGLGASAISQFDGLLVQNEKHVGSWRLRVSNGLLAGSRGVARNLDDRLRGEIIERLLCDGRVDVAAIAARHNLSAALLGEARPALLALAGRGLIDLHDWTVRILPEGRPYARLAAAAFDTRRASARGQFSQAV
jgi:oxygen-independent coproporphyrinogen-3 oxidase